jgi:flagellar motor component MotA
MKNIKKTNLVLVLMVEALVIIAGLLISLFIDAGKIDLASLFIDIPTLMIILLFSIPAIFCSGMWKDFIHAFSAGKKEYTVCELKRSEKAVSMIQKFVLIGGFFCAFVSLIVCLSQLDNYPAVGKNIAVICVSGLYTAILEFLLIPVNANVGTALIDAMNTDEELSAPPHE